MLVFRIRLLLAASVCLLALTGCGSADEDPGPGGSDSDSTEQVTVYSTGGEQFDPVEREVPAENAPEAAVEALLEVPGSKSYIPPGTEVEEVSVDPDGQATVELSEEFLDGIPASPAARTRRQQEAVEGRVAQVTYTLTSVKGVNRVKLESGGISVGQATGREDFARPDKKPPPPKATDEQGAATSRTRNLQRQLARLGYLPRNAVDGVAGYQTSQAVMAFQSWEGLGRDGVAGPQTRAALRQAKRPRPRAKRPQRLMEVHIGKGVLLLVRDGRAIRTIHISAGAPGNSTPTGRYEIFRKELMSWSVPFSTWLPYASYFNNGIAFHEYPDVPPYPASHGCVRVPSPEARRVYDFARMGTKVVVRS